MKKINLEPVIVDESTIVQYTDKVTVEKGLSLTVPNGYQAVVFIDEKVLFRVESCVGRRLAEYGKELLGKQCRIAFVRTKAVPAMAWGFGNIQVNNERLKEAYRVGANGKYFVEVVQIPKLIEHFANDNNITVEKLRDCTISFIKNIGTALLGEYFAKTDISVFENSAHAAELRTNLLNKLQGESVFAALGLRLKDLTVDGIYVNEDDLALIRSRINETEKDDKSAENALRESERAAEDFSRRLDEEFAKLRESIAAASSAGNAAELEKLREQLTADLTSKLGDKMREMQDSISDSIEEKFQALLPLNEKAREEYIKNLKITARVCIEKAADEDGLVPAAGMLYTNIEENLIKKFRLRYENKKFVMDYDDYLSLADEAPGLLSRYDLSPTVFTDDEGAEVTEIPPHVRFYEAGLSVQGSLRAKDYWCFLNKLRHKSPENNNFLCRKFPSFAQEKKYISDALDFFSAHGLYTKD